jgi:2-dehydro-3-deoxyphosphogluconate aldolase / (4S)-4-hydroxy-2-oxoglutarate aldolase
MDASQLLNHCRIVPVVAIHDKAIAVDLAICLRDAGIKAIEVTLRTDDALQAIEAIANGVPDIITGAGSIRVPSHFDDVAARGARFAVSPGASEKLLAAANKARLPFVPGGATASEIISLSEHGYTLQKFFPAELSGGMSMLKALSAPLPEVRFFPTGGITAELAPSYLALSCVTCVGGSWFVSPALLADKDFNRIGQLAKQAVHITAATNLTSQT